jgi:hypothetical protein
MERLRRITNKNVILGLLYILYICLPYGISQPISPNDGVVLCQSNCNTTTAYDGNTGRLIGPTQSNETRPYPWSIAAFPSKSKKFCQLGCQLFFEEFPWTVTCKQNCEYYYRYQSTVGYSNIADLAKLECFDGCDIGYQVSQAGYYSSEQRLIPCPAGTFRVAVANVSINALKRAHSCDPCPYGTYRTSTLGVSSNDCTQCPIGKYLNATGNNTSY